MRTIRRFAAPALVAALALTALAAAVPVASPARADAEDSPFAGLGTWVDVYDTVSAVQPPGASPAVAPDNVDDMAALGVRTVYLQAAQDDDRTPGDTIDPALLGRFLRRAHDRGLQVVAWYVPKLGDPAADLRRIAALRAFRSGGERFDGIALDLEWTQDVPDPEVRSDALVKLSRDARALVGQLPLAAIVLEPLLLEEVSPRYWPGYPYRRLQSSYDAWLPMSYWTNRTPASGLRDGALYTRRNVTRLRSLLGDEDAPVHVIGGVGDAATSEDVAGFVRAARRNKAIGWSLYDFATTSSAWWPILRGS